MTAVLLHLPDYAFVPDPPESHHWFGAGFLFFGVLLVVEALAGKVWFRSRLRAAIWPAGALGMGWGLIVVAGLDPADRVIHFTTGLLVMLAAWTEMRFRFGEASRFSADVLVVLALLGSGFEMGVIHGKGDTFTAVGHAALGATAAMMAFARVYQSRRPESMLRHALTGVLVIVLALNLLLFQP